MTDSPEVTTGESAWEFIDDDGDRFCSSGAFPLGGLMGLYRY